VTRPARRSSRCCASATAAPATCASETACPSNARSAACPAAAARAASVPHVTSLRAAAARTCSTTAAAQAVGVLCAPWATRSATLESISWPIPVRTGTGAPAISRARRSESNVDRSVREPPPRTRSTTSGRDATARVRPARSETSAPWPWTRASTSPTRNPIPLDASSWSTSWQAGRAVARDHGEVQGGEGERDGGVAPDEPLRSEGASVRSRAAARRPRVCTGSISETTSWMRPKPYCTRPRTRTSMPSVRRKPGWAASARSIRSRLWRRSTTPSVALSLPRAFSDNER
jgi:hypothetical protein